VPTLTLAALAGLARGGDLHEAVGVAVGAPAVVVTGPLTDEADRAQLAADVESLPCVLVGAPGSAPALAAFVDVMPAADELDDVLAVVERAPIAATAFVLLLRASERRTVDEGLVAESATYSLLQAGPEFAAWRAGRPRRATVVDSGSPLIVTREGDVLSVRFHRPAVHNAYDAATRDALVEALQLALIDPDLRVALAGDGPSFCSGGDLDEFGTRADPASAHAVRLARSAARLLARVGERVEVHVHGACMGSGIELAAFARRVVADPGTRIALPEVGLGLIPGAGGTVSLPRRIGRHRTALLGLRSRPIDAATALAWGLVDAVEPRTADRPPD
jgi:enoyl-CoA hydratase/carnithine racemase